VEVNERHAPRFFCALLVTLLAPICAWAADPENPAAAAAVGTAPPASPARPEPGTPRWTISAEAIVLGRLGGGVNQTLVQRVPGTYPFDVTASAPGTEAFNSNQFRQGFSAGPKLGLTYRGDSGRGAELSFFNIFGQSATRSTGPTSPQDWLVMKAPGTFWQTQDFAYQAMTWKATTSLYGVEANGRLSLSDRVTVLGGVRWFRLNDDLQGTLTPADLTEPSWKQNAYTDNLSQITPGGPAGNYPPFWNTSATNNLYGAQIGVGATILEAGRLSLYGLLKAGLFDNNATQSTGVSMRKSVYPSQATTNRPAFVGEAGLQLKYQAGDDVTLKLGYTVLWFTGVALAPGQIRETSTTPTAVRALGVNCGSNIVFQGTTAGLEYSF
jgi:hypothetical protein